ncbi:cyclopropane-fatty-acyl-phospholipid synthase family protein [Rhizobiaceae bacterium n13]|uniref:Cyclopropane-fatty-acyl-phospholipid synthase family protein n=1 Tax=Ferirhizobium litorale TaxID=2927786 RepID=A0AAE3U1W8_9HYPH|nr:cyclopropane-fatty-acyl-phospholipid synthase family protein [Fererhizobium litorale]MDI7865071.1 cyclopropane-fatty-acyl-phospholipid synthase family protein [Fererhizobium litorale]MDI7922916.1 cyclopropane-fatty-acyl-phospholipid synthase family protein [Fererhizobium litorale]
MTNSHFSKTISETAELLSSENIARLARNIPARAQLVLRSLLHMEYGALELKLPDGRLVKVQGKHDGPEAAAVLHNWNMPQRAITGGTNAVAESYLDGDWDSPDVGAFLELFLVNQHIGNKFPNSARGLLRLIERIRHWRNSNSLTGSKRNIAAHYDLGNAFYREWLDPTMTYSSALYANGASDLQSAQTAKYRALATAAGIAPGDHVLEIGCGWGGFAEFAAREIGCKVTGLTISREQLSFARERMERAGLSDRVELKFQDYRHEDGLYDRIVSIEMFEAVGEKYWPAYFSKLSDCLKPGGTAGLQIITIQPEAYKEYRSNPDFIQKYIFPGGMLPTRDHLVRLGQAVNLSLARDFGFGHDYARTLGEWRGRFWSVWDRLKPLGFDDRFKRLWEYYFYYCEAGFRSGNIDVRQVVFTKQ